MKVLVFGSKEWNNYGDVMRNMTMLLEDYKYNVPEGNQITIAHGGLPGAETMVTEYIGKVEKFLRQKGMRIKEELFKPNATTDYDVISRGADYAIVFSTYNDKRTAYCIKMLKEFEIPVKIVKA